MEIVGKPGSLALVRKKAGAKKQKRPMTVEKFAIYLLIGMAIVTAPVFYGMYTGSIHSRWNYDDSEWHWEHQQKRKRDLEFERLNHELYEMTKRVGVLENYVNQVLRLNPDIKEDFDAEVHNNSSNGHDNP